MEKEETIVNTNEANNITRFLDLDSTRLYLDELTFDALSADEERDLFLKAKSGDKNAYNDFINSYLRLVVFFAKRFKHCTSDYSDLVQEGNIGLCIAFDKFDINKNCRFTTYASEWILQKMRRFLSNNSGNIRIPTHFYWEVVRVKKYISDKQKICEPVPSNDIIARDLDLTVKEVENALNYNGNTISYDVNVGEDDNSTILDFIQSEADVEGTVLDEVYTEDFIKLLQNIKAPERNKEIFFKVTGVLNGQPRTLESVANEYHITRERVRQIVAKLSYQISNNTLIRSYYTDKKLIKTNY